MINKKKFLIVLGFLVVFIFLFAFNNKVFAVEGNVDVTTIGGLGVSLSTNSIISNPNNSLVYFQLEPGYYYEVTIDSNVNVGFTNEIPSEGLPISGGFQAQTGTLTIVGRDYKYLFFNLNSVNHTISVNKFKYVNDVPNMLAEELTLQNLWTDINPVVPIVAIGVLFGLGFYLFKRSSKGTSKHQAKM